MLLLQETEREGENPPSDEYEPDFEVSENAPETQSPLQPSTYEIWQRYQDNRDMLDTHPPLGQDTLDELKDKVDTETSQLLFQHKTQGIGTEAEVTQPSSYDSLEIRVETFQIRAEELRREGKDFPILPEEALQNGEAFRDMAGRQLSEVDYKKRTTIASEAQSILAKARQRVAERLDIEPAEVLINMGIVAESIAEAMKKYEDHLDIRTQFKWEDQVEGRKIEYNLGQVERSGEINQLELLLAKFGSFPENNLARVEHIDELISKNWRVLQAQIGDERTVNIFFAEGMSSKTPIDMVRLDIQMERILETASERKTETTNYVVLPESKYCPRGGFAYENTAVVNADTPYFFPVAAHEKVHERLGPSQIDALTEGAAIYFAHERFPGDVQLNYPQALPHEENVVDAIVNTTEKQAALSHTQLLEENPKLKNVPVHHYEYAYPLGAHFVGYFVGKYGKERFMQLYIVTTTERLDLYDSQTGEKVKEAGFRIAAQRKLMDAALRHTGVKPEAVHEEFYRYLQEQQNLARAA